MDKDEFVDAVKAGEPLIAQSKEALKRYWQARGFSAPPQR